MKFTVKTLPISEAYDILIIRKERILKTKDSEIELKWNEKIQCWEEIKNEGERL